MVAFTVESRMLAIILFSLYLAPLKAVEIQQPVQQILKGPMTYLPPDEYLPPVLSPLLPPPYVTKMDTRYQVPMESNNCQNSELLQKVLSLVSRLLKQEKNSQIEKPNEVQLEILALLKKYIQFKESQNGENIKKKYEETIVEPEKVPFFVMPDDENPTRHMKTELILKYKIPNTSCKDAINVLIQALYNVYSQLNFVCEQTGKCNFQSHFPELRSILNDLFPSPTPKHLNSNKISYEIPHVNDPENQIFTYQARPEVNLNDAPSAKNINFQLNKILSNRKENIYQDNINDYNILLEKLLKINKAENKDSVLKDLTEQLYTNELNENGRQRTNYVPIPAMNYVPNKILSFDEFVKGFQDRNSKLADDHASAIANEYKQINVNNDLSQLSQSHHPLDLQVPNGKLFTAPDNLLHPNLNPEIENFPKDLTFSKVGSLQMEVIKKLLTPKIQERFLKPLDVNRKNIQIINHESDVNYKGYPIFNMNPQAPSYFPDYFHQDVYGSKLLNSQHSASVHNLVKLNLASDNNGFVELTYVLKKPEPSLSKRYYYVKYRLPYKAFILKISDVSRNPYLKSNPLRLYEELLSVSNLAEVSPDLKSIGNDELIKLTRDQGALVEAKVLPASHSKTDEYLKTIQNLNAKLNTNEILNLIKKGTRLNNDATDPSFNLKSHKLNDKELLSKVHLDPSLLFSSNPYFANINRNYLPNSLPNPIERNTNNNFTALSTNNINSPMKYDTAVNLQSFVPNSLLRGTEKPKTLFGW